MISSQKNNGAAWMVDVVEPLEPPRCSLRPARKGRTVEMHAVSGPDLHLPVQRREPGKLGNHDMGHQRGWRQAVLHQSPQRLRLRHRSFTAPARIFGPDHAQHPQDRRNDVFDAAGKGSPKIC
jgi:hypothetical protein